MQVAVEAGSARVADVIRHLLRLVDAEQDAPPRPSRRHSRHQDVPGHVATVAQLGAHPEAGQMDAAIEAELHGALGGVLSLHAKIAQPRPGPLAPGLRPGPERSGQTDDPCRRRIRGGVVGASRAAQPGSFRPDGVLDVLRRLYGHPRPIDGVDDRGQREGCLAAHHHGKPVASGLRRPPDELAHQGCLAGPRRTAEAQGLAPAPTPGHHVHGRRGRREVAVSTRKERLGSVSGPVDVDDPVLVRYVVLRPQPPIVGDGDGGGHLHVGHDVTPDESASE